MKKSADAFRTISEVADWLGVQAHVLRFWESKFSQVKPVKRAGGRRYYRPADMLLLGGIRKLLHDDGLTIKGVQKLLREEGVAHVSDQSRPLDDLTAAQVDSKEDEQSQDSARDLREEPDLSTLDATPAFEPEPSDDAESVSEDAFEVEPLEQDAPLDAHAQDRDVPDQAHDDDAGDVHVVDSVESSPLIKSEPNPSASAPVLEDFGERGSPETENALAADPLQPEDTDPVAEPDPVEAMPEIEMDVPSDTNADIEPALSFDEPSPSPELDALAADIPDIEAVPIEEVAEAGSDEPAEPAPEQATAPVPLIVEAPDGPAPQDITALPGVLTRAVSHSALSKEQLQTIAPLVSQLRALHDQISRQAQS